MIVKQIPNLLTLLNLSCGILGIICLFQNDLVSASYLIWTAAAFDFLDGFVAGLFNARSEIGKQLDSLADLVSFGVLPALIMYSLISQYQLSSYLEFSPILIGIGSAVRLAKFNIDTSQTDHFLGIPTPANALLISSFSFSSVQEVYSFLFTSTALILLTFVLSLLLIVRVPIVNLKFNGLSISSNWDKYLLILVSLIVIAVFNIVAIPIIFAALLIISLISGALRT